MKKIDLYILRKFLGTFFFILFLLVTIAVVIDLSEKIDNFIRSEASASMIFSQYYLNFIPYIAALLGPFFVLVAVVFFTSQLADRSEVVAMTSGGVSFYRLMLPYFMGAMILSSLLLLTNHYLVPKANKKRIAFEIEYLTSWKNVWSQNLHRKIDTDSYIFFGNFTTETYSGSRFSLEKVENNQLIYKLNADKASWIDSLQIWRFENYTIRTYQLDEQTIYKGSVLDTVLAFSPSDIGVKLLSKEEMSTTELKSYIAALIAGGHHDIVYYQLELERRTGSAFSLIILSIIGYSLASRKVRGGLGLHIVTAIIIAGLYEMTSKFTTTYTTNAGLSAFWGIWIPNLIFSLVAIIFVRFAQK